MADTFNPETASLDELRTHVVSLGLENESDDVPVVEEGVQARDEKGRFVAKEDEPKFVREIDLGDGSGKQVFKADSLEDLVDVLAEAQTNATRKIREMAAEKTAAATPPPVVEKKPLLTEDEEWVIGQEFMTKPSEAFGKMFEKMVGKPVEAFKNDLERVSAWEQSQRDLQVGQDATAQFKQEHPEYVAVPANGQKIERYLKTYKLDNSLASINQAYKELSESGLLVTEHPDAANADTETESPETSRIANRSADDVAPRRKVASGLSARRNAPTTKSLEPTEEEMKSMSMEQLRDLAMKSL